jgi:hypothetical protein
VEGYLVDSWVLEFVRGSFALSDEGASVSAQFIVAKYFY